MASKKTDLKKVTTEDDFDAEEKAVLDEQIVYGIKVKALDERLRPIARKLALSPKERLKRFKDLRCGYNSAFIKDDGTIDIAYLAELKEGFLQLQDPSEYAFAIKFFKSYDFYLQFKKNSSILRNEIKKWQAELEIKLRSNAFRALARKSATTAEIAKYLFEGRYKKLINYEQGLADKGDVSVVEDDSKKTYTVFNDAEDEILKQSVKNKQTKKPEPEPDDEEEVVEEESELEKELLEE